MRARWIIFGIAVVCTLGLLGELFQRVEDVDEVSAAALAGAAATSWGATIVAFRGTDEE